MIRTVSGRRYEDVRRIVVEDGFVQQHVLRGEAPSGGPEMLGTTWVVVAAGRVARAEQYLDPAQAAVLRRRQAPVPTHA